MLRPWVLVALALPGLALAGPPRPTRAPAAAGRAHAGASDPFVAAQSGVDWLLNALCDWLKNPANVGDDCASSRTATCVGCHVQGEAVFALSRSAARCYPPPVTACALPGDLSPIEFSTRFVADAQRKDCIIGPRGGGGGCPRPPLDPTTRDGYPPELGSIGQFPPCGGLSDKIGDFKMTQTTHGGLNLAGFTTAVDPAYSANLVALANWLITSQDPAGNWVADHNVLPVDQGDSFATGAAAIEIAAARPFASAAENVAYDDALAAVRSWVDLATLTTNQDKALALAGLRAAGVPADDPLVDRIRVDLIDDPLADGGWAERPGLASNAYATGQSVWALHEAGVPFDDPALCAGVSWLLANQNPDGSWSMGVTGTSTDSTFGSEFTATSWPVLALGSIRRFAVAVDPPPAPLDSCAAEVFWDVVIRNPADDPCALFPRSDTIDIAVSNDTADGVRVATPSVVVPAGGSTLVRLTWTRTASAPGATSTTTLVATSTGASGIGCPVEARADFVVLSTDPLPADAGNTFRAVRAGDDVLLSWAADPAARTYALHRSDVRDSWPGPPFLGGLPSPDARFADVSGSPSLLLYRGAGESCSGREGP